MLFENTRVFHCQYHFIVKYPYHFLTVAICWCHPTQWPTTLIKPLGYSSPSSRQLGHMTTLFTSLFLLAINSRTCFGSGEVTFLLRFFFNMANNNESSDNKAKESSSCDHFMPSWDNHRYCFKCREANKCDDLCALKKECLLCASFSEDQKRKLTVKHSKGKKSVKETSLEKSKIDDSILDEDDNSSVVNVAHLSSSNNQALAAILSQLTSISNRLSAVEKRDSPMQADMTVSMDASTRGSSDCRKRTISSENTSVEIQSKCSAEETPCSMQTSDNRVSVPPKRSRIEISDGKYDSSQEEKQPGPSYSDTLLTVKKWLDIDITDTDAIIAPSVFSQAHKIKKSAQASLALPPAENMVNLWDFKKYEASGISKDQDHMKNKSSRKNPLARGHFLNFDRPNMKWYNMTPQPHALGAPKLQDAFRNITAPQFQTPTSVSTPMKQYTLWESVNRENINVLNHIFWFNSTNIKATEEMEKQFNIIKSAESEVDFNNAMDYVQECLQLQSTINQSLGKSLESLLGSSMTLSSNLLLNRRDNYLKHCSKDVTEDDISRLRNASFTPNEVFPVETLSEVQRNFIQWAHVNRDSFKSRKEHPARHDDRRDSKSQSRSFRPYHESSATSSSASSSTTSNRGRGSFSSRPFRGRGGRKK